MARGLKVHTRESVRKSRCANLSAKERARRDEQDRKVLSRWADNCRREGPLLFRGWKGEWVLNEPLETKKPTSSR